MNARRLARLLLASLAAVLALTPRPVVQAAPPTVHTVSFHDTFVLENVCPFPVQLEFVGTTKISVHDDTNGEWVMMIERPLRWSVIFTNLATGTSFTSVNAGAGIYRLEDDGSTTYAAHGVIAIVHMSGEGVVFAEVGRIVYQDGNVIFEAGQRQGTWGDVQELCSALADTSARQC